MSETEVRIAVTSFFANRGKPATGDDVDLFETEYIDSRNIVSTPMAVNISKLKVFLKTPRSSLKAFLSINHTSSIVVLIFLNPKPVALF